MNQSSHNDFLYNQNTTFNLNEDLNASITSKDKLSRRHTASSNQHVRRMRLARGNVSKSIDIKNSSFYHMIKMIPSNLNADEE